MPFPLIKLGYLALKHISKPLANSIKLKAKSTPFLRNRVLLPAAQCKCSCSKISSFTWARVKGGARGAGIVGKSQSAGNSVRGKSAG